MNNEHIPQVLYYTTIQFEDGSVESPHFMVFDKPAEGVIAIRDHYRDLNAEVATITLKEIEFVQSVTLTPDCTVLTPLNDQGVDDDFRDPFEQAEMVERAERAGASRSLVSILPFEQDNDTLMCKAYYMGPCAPVVSADEFVSHMEHEPFVTSMPLDVVWLYRPTGEWKEVGSDEKTN